MNRNQQSSDRPSTIFSAGASEQPAHAAPREEHKPKHEKPAHEHGDNKIGFPSDSKWFRWGGSAAVVIVALLIGAALALFVSFRPASESDQVDKTKLQAVFLTNDQVYFGKVTSVNDKYVVLTNIYYLQTSSATAANKNSGNGSNISLVKLGCELHKPQDRMVINQSQVSFWENLQADGQVAQAVASYVKANPNGQKCDTTSQSTNPVQGGTGTTPNTNQATTDTTKQN